MSTVYRILRRWAEEGPAGLEDRQHGRPPGVRKVTLKAMEAVRRLQQNPHLGEFRVHAAVERYGSPEALVAHGCSRADVAAVENGCGPCHYHRGEREGHGHKEENAAR